MPKKPKQELTLEQLERLLEFKAEHGRTWKDTLRHMWMNGQDANQRDGGLLRQIRNNFGPTWLNNFRG